MPRHSQLQLNPPRLAPLLGPTLTSSSYRIRRQIPPASKSWPLSRILLTGTTAILISVAAYLNCIPSAFGLACTEIMTHTALTHRLGHT